MRKLVTLRVIEDILPIENADMIEQIVIGGWSLVSQKGIHSKGDTVLYFEIDSFLPESDPRFKSFMKFGTRKFDDVVGHKVKTIRLRGVISQGIVMPVSEFPEIKALDFDTDYSEAVGVVKWEAPETSGYSGDTKGNWPSFLKKSDQPRIQNVYNSLSRNYSDSEFVGTLKMDGSSVTVYCESMDDLLGFPKVGFCSRNLELKFSPIGTPLEERGSFERGVINSELANKVFEMYTRLGVQYAIQGELVGPGIQGNFEKFDTYQIFAYNIFDISNGEYLDYNEFRDMCLDFDIQMVPEVYTETKVLSLETSDILKMAEGKGLRADYREGIVWKQVDGKVQFKAISNKYLIKKD